MEPSVHIFSVRQVSAINAAMAAGRPLLIRGRPGTGKSQIARAAAVALNRSFVHQTVDGRTDTRDLLWTFDAVERLAQAQVAATASGSDGSKDEGRPSVKDVEERLAKPNFIQPGALWWALDPKGAHVLEKDSGEGAFVAHIEKTSEEEPNFDNGMVVLIDEIDKADPSVPNGLLDALGHGGFNVPTVERVSRDPSCPQPLIIITTNEERALPDAFLRRCLVLSLALPKDPDELKEALVSYGRAHFQGQQTESEHLCGDELLEKAADMVVEDRALSERRHLSVPGVAEYLDLLRAVVGQSRESEARMALLDDVRDFALKKHPEELGR